jgi:hypothetical protein
MLGAMTLMLLAPIQKGNAVVNKQAPVKDPNALAIVDEIQLPANVRAGGAKGSKYIPELVAKAIETVKVGQGFVAPTINGIEAKKHRSVLSLALKNYYGENGKMLAEGQEAMKFTTAIVDGGVAVRRDA